jgi:AcrR family transcriptional regulator
MAAKSTTTRRRRSDGERSRAAILREAARLATVEGLGGLSLARLADAVGMSKSGLFAHFGSKEELQLATIATASEVFTQEVVEPALAAPTALTRLEQPFPGGCFFASVAAELDTRPGPVRDAAMEFIQGWITLLEETVRGAQAEGTIDAAEDAAQLAFELEAFMLIANAQLVTVGERVPLDRAWAALSRRLAAARASS